MKKLIYGLGVLCIVACVSLALAATTPISASKDTSKAYQNDLGVMSVGNSKGMDLADLTRLKSPAMFMMKGDIETKNTGAVYGVNRGETAGCTFQDANEVANSVLAISEVKRVELTLAMDLDNRNAPDNTAYNFKYAEGTQAVMVASPMISFGLFTQA